jgi:uncharacterized coiled-coil DUF342 family protein
MTDECMEYTEEMKLKDEISELKRRVKELEIEEQANHETISEQENRIDELRNESNELFDKLRDAENEIALNKTVIKALTGHKE